MRSRPPAVMTDLYELTMAAGYWRERRSDSAVFELFARRLPANRGYLVAAGIEAIVDFLLDLRFLDDEIAYLRSLPVFAGTPDDFFEMLAGLRFTGDLWAVDEGTPMWPNEPILAVAAPLIEAQIVETALLAILNFPTSVATKASRIVDAARERPVVEFGARRAHGTEAALIASRAAYLGGCAGTSNVEAGILFGLPVFGTIAHSWIMSFDDEIAAFRSYRDAFPGNSVLLIDTYDTVRAARRLVEAFEPGEISGVRIDSGDLGALSRTVRGILDDGGFGSTRIFVSGDLNEWSITDLVQSGAPIDSFGVGTDLVTVKDAPALGVVYKLVELDRGSRREYKMKHSEGKATLPGRKQVWRSTGKDGCYGGDVVTLADEPRPRSDAEPLLRPIIERGKPVAASATLSDIRARSMTCVSRIPTRLRTLESPGEAYQVVYSERILTLAEEIRSRH